MKDAADRVSQWSNEEDGVARELEAAVVDGDLRRVQKALDFGREQLGTELRGPEAGGKR